MRVHIDSWDPAYGTGFDVADSTDRGGPGARSSAQLDPEVETASAAWQPLEPAADVRAPDTVLLVDGVRRIDAGVWVTGDDGVTHRGLAASYAAGVVRCDLRRGAAEVAVARIRRGLFTASPQATDLAAGSVRYDVQRVGSDDQAALVGGIQAQLAALEAAVSAQARTETAVSAHARTETAVAAPSRAGLDDLLVVDGPLRGRAHLDRALGYVKTHQVEYLPPHLSTVVTALGPGQRCPVFLLGTSWHRYTWYLRLPGPGGSPWSGIVRAECSAELTVAEAVALADLSATTLPRFASAAYKDPRAPQNLVPIAGLERRLRGLLGDARLVHRALVAAARTPTPAASR